jgi:hypothetical protein
MIQFLNTWQQIVRHCVILYSTRYQLHSWQQSGDIVSYCTALDISCTHGNRVEILCHTVQSSISAALMATEWRYCVILYSDRYQLHSWQQSGDIVSYCTALDISCTHGNRVEILCHTVQRSMSAALMTTERETLCHTVQRWIWGAHIFSLDISEGSGDSVVGIETGYGLDDRGVGVRVPVGSGIFSSPRLPDRLWAPPSLLSNGYCGLFSGGKAAGLWIWPLTSN